MAKSPSKPPTERQTTPSRTSTAPPAIRALVDKFAEHAETYHRAGYNETQLRQDFLDPFFAALGWDVHNQQGIHENYRDVILEQALRVEQTVRAPDYCFRIGPTPKFFVEAKKPAVDIKSDVGPAFQLRRYAWTAKLPLSILTDFEELAVYDCRIKPDKADKASTARVLFLSYTEYIDRWDEIASVFSRDAILHGSFDKFAESNKKKRGTAEVDAAFLEEIEAWRESLAKNLSLRNESLDDRELNVAVRRIIDRIIFLRMCEGRGIEDYGRLQALLNGERVYPRLVEMFHRADEKYNSGLFHFQPERGREQPDELTPALAVDDKVLKDILRRLYYPESPYEFAALPADILGQVYEQFLGKVIRLTAGHRAKIEEKPEVRKAGGVYYTPTYIVDYIVENTVGKLVEGKTPQEVGGLTAAFKPAKNGRPLTVLDPACGSGSFLIVAYQFLMNWYLKQYTDVDKPEQHSRGAAPRIYQTGTGDWRLTTAERKRILLAHIYGVDIDYQAVEVTKLSLLLKALEGETKESVVRMLFHKERALPDLANNIKCGNSLIGTDFYHGQQRDLFSEDDRYRINAFDWKGKHGFPDIFAGANPGFDAVIGNPPYVYRNAIDDVTREYYEKHFKSTEGNFDLYKYFLERGSDLLMDGGRLGMIVSASFLVQPTFHKLRHLLLDRTTIERLSPLGPRVFSGATVDTVVLVLKRSVSTSSSFISVQAPAIPTQLSDTEVYRIRQSRFVSNPKQSFDYRLSDIAAKIVARITSSFPPIEDEYEFGVGINTGFIRKELCADKKLDARFHPMVPGSGIERYGSVTTSGWIMYDADHVRSRGKLGRSLPPVRFFDNPKILIVRTRNLSLRRRVIATLDAQKFYNLNRLSNIISRRDAPLTGLLGLLNSSLFNWLFSTRFYDYEIKPVYLRSCPLADSKNKSLNLLVQQMLDLNARLPKLKTDHERTVVARQIEATDRQIDHLVYALYGLTDQEIALVEGATR